MLYHTVSSVSSRVCTLSFFTFKVLTHLFQVKRPHKSFSFSLLLPISPFILRGEAECVLEGSIPRQPHHCFSSSYLFPPSPFLLLWLSHPTFIVSDWMSASIYARLHSTGGSLIFSQWDSARSWGSLSLSNQPFFNVQNYFDGWFYFMTTRSVLDHR